jgi:hypothetical protein
MTEQGSLPKIFILRLYTATCPKEQSSLANYCNRNDFTEVLCSNISRYTPTILRAFVRLLSVFTQTHVRPRPLHSTSLST